MKRKRILIISIVLVVIFVIVFSITRIISSIESNLEQLVDLRIENVDLTEISDGTYLGNHKVFPISVKVEVTVINHEITNIEIIKHSNGQGDKAEVISDRVIDAQSLEVDVVSGATYSSKVILKAIEDALNNGKE